MKSINIKGKEYYPVVERVKAFHEESNLSNFTRSITTEIISNNENTVTVKATVILGDHTYTGHSQASWTEGMMKSVALEVAETSAVGRALGFAGIGIDTGIASADEMRKVSKIENNNEDLPF